MEADDIDMQVVREKKGASVAFIGIRAGTKGSRKGVLGIISHGTIVRLIEQDGLEIHDRD